MTYDKERLDEKLKTENCFTRSIEDFIQSNYPGNKNKLKEIVIYNIFGGKRTRSKLFIDLFLKLSGKKDCSLSEYLVSECIELMQGSFVIIDDIMDNAELRRKKKCWHMIHGLKALKDGTLVLCFMYFVLQKCLKENFEKCKNLSNANCKKSADLFYYQILKIFNGVVFKTCLGQIDDAIKKNVENWAEVEKIYNIKRYHEICVAKNSFYTFVLPVKLSFYMSLNDDKYTANVHETLCKFGILHQMKDDFLNFYPEVSGKTESDLYEKKLTFFLCQLVSEGKNETLLEYLIDQHPPSSQTLNILRSQIEKYLKEFHLQEKNFIDEIIVINEVEDSTFRDFCVKTLYP